MNEVTFAPDLLRLARLHGINEAYWDSLGVQHILSERTLRQLLVGFGVLDSVDASEHTIGQAVHAERVALWRPGLPAVVVVTEHQKTTVELVVPEHQLEALWQWRIDTESGGTLDATFTPGHLSPSGNHEDVEGWASAHKTNVDDRQLQRFQLPLPTLPSGYHRLSINCTDTTNAFDEETRCVTRLIVAPARCYLPEQRLADDAEPGLWGLALQLYAVSSKRNWGMGDFTDLSDAVGVAAQLGAHVVGINPLHALFLHEPEQASPYGPSSRLFLNPMYIDIEHVVGFDDLKQSGQSDSGLPDQAELNTLRNTEFVDYSAVVNAKLPVLDKLFQAFIRNHLEQDTDLAASFREFLSRHGAALEKFACFEALRENQAQTSQGTAGDWHLWPVGFQHPESDEVARFAQTHRQSVQFHSWLQWLVHEQLKKAAAVAQDKSMKVGLYRDLAVGVSSGGSDSWSNQTLFANRINVGAPPDDFSAKGQDWGLPPLIPQALRDSGYELFTQILRSNMQAAGALRIDHVMGLMRIFCIPGDETPANGAYVDYPIDDLLAIVALESQRQSCIVIGEDLGTVPDGLREKLQATGVLSYRLMYFEKHYNGDQSFLRPHEYPVQSLVAANTHDLPTLRSFWCGSDLKLRESLNLFPGENMFAEQMRERSFDRDRLLQALTDDTLLSQETKDAYRESAAIDEALIAAIHRYLARTRSMILIASLEDLLGQEQQINLPGTDRDLYPNWRRKLPLSLEQWMQHDSFLNCAAAINAERNGR